MFSNWALIWQDQATVESSTCPSCIFGKLVQSTSNVKPAYQRKINKPNQEHICGTTRPRQMESKLSRRYQPWTRHDLICPAKSREDGVIHTIKNKVLQCNHNAPASCDTKTHTTALLKKNGANHLQSIKDVLITFEVKPINP